MDRETCEALKLLEEIRRIPIPSGPVRLSRWYLRALTAWEKRPAHRDGADKTWVELALREYRDYYRAVRRRR